MKKIVSFISFVLLSFPAICSTTKTVSLTYDISDFFFNDIDNCLYIGSPNITFSLDSDSLKPALPLIPIYVLVDVNSDFLSCNIVSSESLVREDVRIGPNTQVNPNYIVNTHSTLRSLEYVDASYPFKAVEYNGTYMMGGYKVLGFSVCPFRYDVTNHNLYFKTNISLIISLSTVSQRSLFYPSSSMRNSGCKLVCNSMDIDQLYPLNNNILNVMSN